MDVGSVAIPDEGELDRVVEEFYGRRRGNLSFPQRESPKRAYGFP